MIVHCEPDNPGGLVGSIGYAPGRINAGVISWSMKCDEVKKYKGLMPNDVVVTAVLDRDLKCPDSDHVDFHLLVSNNSYAGGNIESRKNLIQDGRVWIFVTRDPYGGRSSSNDGSTLLGNIYKDTESLKKASP